MALQAYDARQIRAIELRDLSLEIINDLNPFPTAPGSTLIAHCYDVKIIFQTPIHTGTLAQLDIWYGRAVMGVEWSRQDRRLEIKNFKEGEWEGRLRMGVQDIRLKDRHNLQAFYS